jgi:hypothetical protein
MLNIDTRTADKKTTYSTICRAIAIRAVHPHSWYVVNFIYYFIAFEVTLSGKNVKEMKFCRTLLQFVWIFVLFGVTNNLMQSVHFFEKFKKF